MSSNKQITLTYLNIRQSIAILIAKLVLIDLIMAAIVIGSYFFIIQGAQYLHTTSLNTSLFLLVFAVAGIIKILIDIYVVLLWLNEYYEITPEYIVHKYGLFYRKQEHYRLDHVRAIDVDDSLLGEIFNFATITLYDIRLNKYLDMYLIHNARRYAKVLKELRPHLELKEDKVWVPSLGGDNTVDEER